MASETTLINVSRVFTAANKPCDELYKDNCPLDKELSKRAKGVVKQCVEKTFLSKMKELDGLFGNFVFRNLPRWFVLRRSAYC